MIVAGITANRKITKKDEHTIEETMFDLMTISELRRIVFGGARGGDTVALQAAINARQALKRFDVELVVEIPDTIKDQPKSTWHITNQADIIHENKRPILRENGWLSFQKRNEAIVNQSTIMVAFWDGQKPSGTYNCVQYASKQQIPVFVISIEGGDK